MLQRSRRTVGLIEPCLPSPAKAQPAGPDWLQDWLHEIKHDGFRLMARRDAVAVRLYTRNGQDFTARFPLIVAAVAALSVRSCLIDGEVASCSVEVEDLKCGTQRCERGCYSPLIVRCPNAATR
jgi:ATP-dependent DNA ligase